MRIEIAPRFSCDNWDTLKPKLEASGDWASSPENWDRAIEVLRSRIQKRFLDSAAKLDGLPYAGFAILALDCLLIETIQAFRNGRNTKSSYESRQAHIAFLTTATRFKDFFSSSQTAHDFYTNVRNGLLHDGETRKGWLVKANPRYALLEPQPGNFYIVNGRKFHAGLMAEFEAYLRELRDPSKTLYAKLGRCPKQPLLPQQTLTF